MMATIFRAESEDSENDVGMEYDSTMEAVAKTTTLPSIHPFTLMTTLKGMEKLMWKRFKVKELEVNWSERKVKHREKRVMHRIAMARWTHHYGKQPLFSQIIWKPREQKR